MCCISVAIFAQKGVLKQANNYYEAERYADAVKYYNAYKKIAKDKNALYRRGVAHYQTNQLDEAIADLTQAYTLGVEDKEVYYYVGRALHSQHQFADATKFYKSYLQEADDEERQAEVIDMITRCRSGLNLQYVDQPAFIENLGSSVNSTYDEVNPIQSPTNPSKYYFSANRDDANGGMRNAAGLKDEIYGHYTMDMYAVELIDGNWTAVNAFHPLLNSAQNDVLQDFSSDGGVMYFMKSLTEDSGTLFADTFTVDRPEGAFPVELHTPMITRLGDTDLHVFNESVILFASKRAGGYGGYDLYVAERKDGQWQNAQNLGPTVNGPYDDRAPFLAKSGTHLYYSSDRTSSMGGFDIYQAVYQVESGSWTEPENMGLPINSGKDDIHFSVSADGMIAMLSSDRAESIGGFDIFLAYMKEQITAQLMYTEKVPFSLEPQMVMMEGDSIEVIVDEGSPVGDFTTPPVKAREYYNTPLYYGADENIVTPQNMTRLNSIYDVMVIFPDTEIMLTCHSMQEGLVEFDLYFSIKRAEKAADYLIDKGIDPSRIHLRGVGSNFPLAQMTINGRKSRLAERTNRRVDVTFYNTAKTNLQIVPDEPVVAENLVDDLGKEYASMSQGLSFKVQITKAKQMYKADVLKKYSQSSIDKRADQSDYVYSLGIYEDYQQARTLKNTLVREGLTAARVDAYLNGRLLSDSEVDALQEAYPLLREYLKYEQK